MRWLLALLLCCGGLGVAQAAEGIISAIHFSGNRVTEERILRQELLISEGDVLDPTRLEQSRQALMNLRLFKRVMATAEPVADGQMEVTFTLEERYYILPLPLLGAKPESEEYSYGAEIRFDNLWGLNQRLKLNYEHKNSLDKEEKVRRELELEYRYPRVMGSYVNLQLDSGIRSQERVLDMDEGSGGYLRDQYLFGFTLSRWLNRRGSSEGWQVKAGLGFQQRRYSEQWGDGLNYGPSQSMDMTWGIGYHKVDEHPYFRDGNSYGYELTQSLEGIGSDYGYTRHLFYWQAYRPLSWVDANFDSQLRVGLASGDSFDGRAYSLGGSNLRGYPDGLDSGNAMLQINLEYQHRVSGYRQLRAVVFSDVGNVWPSLHDIDTRGFHHSVGLGLRWRVQSFVDTTLRVDYGYGLRTGESKAYFSTRANF